MGVVSTEMLGKFCGILYCICIPCHEQSLHSDKNIILPPFLYSHVVQGGPISNHLNKGVNVRKPFQDADLNSVSFQEYHPDFPHKKYTLGYGTSTHIFDFV